MFQVTAAAVVAPDVLPAFAFAAAVILVSPGPDMAFLVAAGVEGGRGAAVRAAVGVTTGVSVWVVVTAAGLGAVLAGAPAVLDVVRLGGGAYLGLLGVRTWQRGGSGGEAAETAEAASDGDFFRRGVIVNLTNAKIAVFFAAFLPQFVDAERGPVALQLLILGFAFQVAGLAVDLATGLAASLVRDAVLRRRRVRRLLDRAAALVYATLAMLLVIDVASRAVAA